MKINVIEESSKKEDMTREERIQKALKYGDFYDITLLTYEDSKK